MGRSIKKNYILIFFVLTSLIPKGSVYGSHGNPNYYFHSSDSNWGPFVGQIDPFGQQLGLTLIGIIAVTAKPDKNPKYINP